jgi:hypothetical protein
VLWIARFLTGEALCRVLGDAPTCSNNFVAI